MYRHDDDDEDEYDEGDDDEDDERTEKNGEVGSNLVEGGSILNDDMGVVIANGSGEVAQEASNSSERRRESSQPATSVSTSPRTRRSNGSMRDEKKKKTRRETLRQRFLWSFANGALGSCSCWAAQSSCVARSRRGASPSSFATCCLLPPRLVRPNTHGQSQRIVLGSRVGRLARFEIADSWGAVAHDGSVGALPLRTHTIECVTHTHTHTHDRTCLTHTHTHTHTRKRCGRRYNDRGDVYSFSSSIRATCSASMTKYLLPAGMP